MARAGLAPPKIIVTGRIMASPAAPLAASRSPVWDALRPSRAVGLTLFFASGLINLLTLTGSLFMMQVYDRVLGSQSLETLVGLGFIATFAYVVQGILDGYRGRILVLVGEKFDAEIAPKVQAANMMLALRNTNGITEALRNNRHVEAIRAFVSGPGPVAACDLPWLPIYLIVAFVIHWSLAVAIIVAGLFFSWLTFMTDRRTKLPGRETFEASSRRAQEVDSALRNAEAAQAMGMRSALASRWLALNDTFLLAQRRVTYSVSGFTIAAKTARMLLQSFVLALGAYLAINGLISSGAIIAASIMSTRALAPIDQAIGAWKPFQAARDGYRALDDLFRRQGGERTPFVLPSPERTLTVTDLSVAIPTAAAAFGQNKPPPPFSERLALQHVRFEVNAGQILCVIGPSASGKSTLGRALTGVWPPRNGTIKLDGAPLDQWSPEKLGPHIGYLPQDVQLFDGTIAENISRFQADATDAKILAAAKAAEFDRHVLAIGGYDRRIGPGGLHLSGGQRQRLGLARAMYGDPFLIVLDEPNSNLDLEGEAALLKALLGVKTRGGIAIVIAHNLRVLEVADLLLALEQGAPLVFGPRDAALSRLKLDALIPRAMPAPAVATTTAANAAQPPPPVAAAAGTGRASQIMQGPKLVLQRGGDKGPRDA